MFIPSHPQNFTLAVGDLPLTLSYKAGRTRVTFHVGDTSAMEPPTHIVTGIPVATEFNRDGDALWIALLTRTETGAHLAHLFYADSTEQKDHLAIQTDIHAHHVEEHLVKLQYHRDGNVISVLRSDNGITWNSIAMVSIPTDD